MADSRLSIAGIAPAIGLAIIFIGAIAAPLLAPYSPITMDIAHTFAPPSSQHWLGTDQLGRDVLSRVMWGGRVSLGIAAVAVALAAITGGLAGMMAGYRGGVVDAIIMRLAEIQFSLPAIILALVLAGAIGPGVVNLVAVLTLANWARFARVIRSEAVAVRTRDFVLVSRLAGASQWRVIMRHILPNVRSTFIVLATLDIGLIVILEATLSFLGLGVQPPIPSWGSMIADGRSFLDRGWWIVGAPGIVLMLTVLCSNLCGDRLRDKLNPSMAGRW